MPRAAASIVIVTFMLIGGGCRPTRYLTSKQALLTNVKLTGAKPEVIDKAEAFVRQKPNRKFLLALYNTFNTENGHYKPASRIKQGIGEEPALFDTTSAELSTRNVTGFLKDNGYFDASVNYVLRIQKKRAYITYVLKPGTPYQIASCSRLIHDAALEALYASFFEESFLKAGDIYRSDNLDAEQSRLTSIYKENGYFKFTKQYVRFLVIDTLHNHTINLTTVVDNPDTGLHRKYTVDTVFMRVNADTSQLLTRKSDSIRHLPRGLLFYDPFNRFNPKITRNTVYLEKSRIFSSNDELVTYKRLAELGVFREIRINYKEGHKDSAARINAFIDGTERKKLNASMGADANFNGSYYGFAPALTYTDRNFLKGAEIFQLKVGGTVNNTFKRDSGIYNRREFSIQANITYPFLALPFYHSRIGRIGGLPHTTVLARYAYVYQPLYSRREFSTNLSYQFGDTRARTHTITPIEFTLLKAHLDPGVERTFRQNGNQARLQSFTSSIINGSAYNYEQNAYLLKTRANFFYVNANLELVGNTLSLADRILPVKKYRNNGKLFGLPYYQYIKPELDLRLYRKVGTNGELIFRFNPGVAYAYGKENGLRSIPFDRQFFVGGPNSIRAWLARQLGPGSYLYVIQANSGPQQRIEIQRRAIDQTGDVKVEGNLEYRFDISRNFFYHRLSGAAFADFGNIWLLHGDVSEPNANFQFNSFLRQIALGTGAGLRYDLSFFIFRFDLGLKLYDPIYAYIDPWVIKKFGNKEFRRDYNTRFGNDLNGYHFLTYNFGIGFPF